MACAKYESTFSMLIEFSRTLNFSRGGRSLGVVPVSLTLTFFLGATGKVQAEEMQMPMPSDAHRARSAHVHHHMAGNAASERSSEKRGKGSNVKDAARQKAPISGGVEAEDVVVTASADPGERRMEDVMMTTSRFGDVVTGKQAKEQQFTTLNDYSYKVPGFRPNITTPHYSRMSIRGLGQPMSGAAGIGYQSETAFVVDNVAWIQPDYQWGDWSNISSFEIGYGPAGTAGGHNSEVGAISIMTALPSFKRKTDYEQTVGNYGHTIEKLDTTGSIIPGHLAYRISGYYDNADGWVHDLLNGKRYQNINRGGVRAQLLGVGEHYTDRFIFSYNEANEYTQYGASAGTGGASAPIGDSVLVYGNGKYAGSYAATLWSRLQKPVLTYNPYRPALANPGKERSNVFTLSNELNYHLGRNTLTSITAVGHFAGVNSGTTDNQNVWIGTGGEMDDYGVQGSQELRLSSPQEDRIAWTVGLYGVDNSAWNRMHHTSFGSDAAAWYSRPAAVTGLTQWEKNYNTNLQFAIFAQTTIHIDNKLSLTLGVRNSYDIQKFNNKFEVGYVPGTPYSYEQQRQALMAAGGGGDARTGVQRNDHDGVTAIINPKYQINDNTQIYLLIGHGDKTVSANGNANPINVYNSTTKQYSFYAWSPYFSKPTTSWDYEVGAKTMNFNGQLTSNINLYWNDLYNYQTNQVYNYHLSNGDLANVSYMGNAPHARLYGVELSESLNPDFIPGLEIHGSGAWQQVKYVKYASAPPPTSDAYSGGPATVDESGRSLPGIPSFTFNIGADYHHPVGAIFRNLSRSSGGWHSWLQRSFTAFGYVNEAWWSRNRLTDPLAARQFYQSAYSIVNAGIGLRTDDQNFSITLWAKNLLDARPWTGYSPGSSSSPESVDLTQQGPRYFGGTLHAAF